jgi:hypothetical protein
MPKSLWLWHGPRQEIRLRPSARRAKRCIFRSSWISPLVDVRLTVYLAAIRATFASNEGKPTFSIETPVLRLAKAGQFHDLRSRKRRVGILDGLRQCDEMLFAHDGFPLVDVRLTTARILAVTAEQQSPGVASCGLLSLPTASPADLPPAEIADAIAKTLPAMKAERTCQPL